MTKEQFDALDDTWQTVYLDGYIPIKMVSKRSSKKDHILWYDEDECAHTVHYSKVELNQIDHTNDLGEFAKGLMIGDYYHDRLKDVYKRVTLDTFHKIKTGDLDIGDIVIEQPILLTKDILERNGFRTGNGIASKCWGDSVDDIIFDYMVSCDFCMDGVVKYIHIRAPHIGIGMPLEEVNEFLHALRLCGLCEMADDFKL